MIGGEEEVKNFEQWTEELSKEIFARTDQEEIKVLWKWNEILDDDFEEEE
jgi:hypothetical protein